MSEHATYSIDERVFNIRIDGSAPFEAGSDRCLSTEHTDLTFGQSWYDQGYKAYPLLDDDQFAALKTGLETVLLRILSEKGATDLEGFTLERYHEYIGSDADHYAVVGVTRDLFPEDFTFPLADLIERFESLLGIPLCDISPKTGQRIHVIVRINRPGSTDYNPPHKDIYEDVDQTGQVPAFINFWMPICGVEPVSSLPLAPGSHRFPEKDILRTREGGMVDGKRYRVRMVKTWNGQTTMTRPAVRDGEVLIFTPHLIHGLAHNGLEDTTRMALEFRLFKRS